MFEQQLLKSVVHRNGLRLIGSDLDDQLFFRLVRLHRLEGRILKACENYLVMGFSQQLMEQLDYRWQQVQHRVKTQRAVLAEIAKAYESSHSSESPLVMLKGQTAYMLFNKPHLMRWSSDIDLLGPDPERLLCILEKLGFFVRSPQESYLQATVLRPDIGEVDIHAYYPIMTFDRDVSHESLDSTRYPGHWVQNLGVRRNRLDYRMVIDNSLRFHVEGHILAIPNPSLAVLIAATHVFRNSLNTFPTHIKLAELADIANLSLHPKYDRMLLNRLSRRLGADMSLRFVHSILSTLEMSNSLCHSTDNIDAVEQFYPLTRFYSIWTKAPWTVDDLLFPKHNQSIDPIVDFLGANKVVITRGHLGHLEFSTDPEEGNEIFLERVISYKRYKAIPSISIAASLHSDQICLRIHVASPPKQDSQLVRLQFGSRDYFKWEYYSRTDKHSLTDGGAEWRIKMTDESYTITLKFPVERWTLLSERGTVQAVLMVFIMGEDVSQIMSGALVPLIFELDHA